MTTAPLPDLDPGPAFLSVATVAEACEVETLTVRGWIRDGKLPAVRFPNRRVAVPIDQWTRWVTELAKLRDIGPGANRSGT